jgi:hypothetical protein
MMNPTASPERMIGTASVRNPGGFPRQLYDSRMDSATIPSGTRMAARRDRVRLNRGWEGRGGQFRRIANPVTAMPMLTSPTRSSGARRKSKRPRTAR